MRVMLSVLHTESAGPQISFHPEFIEVCEGLCASDRHSNCVKAAIPLPL